MRKRFRKSQPPHGCKGGQTIVLVLSPKCLKLYQHPQGSLKLVVKVGLLSIELFERVGLQALAHRLRLGGLVMACFLVHDPT